MGASVNTMTDTATAVFRINSTLQGPVVDILGQSMTGFTDDVRYLKSKTDKQVTTVYYSYKPWS